MRHWLILAGLLSAQAIGQQAYRWVDENGQVHYSDRPAPGATEIPLRGAQGYAATPRPAAPSAARVLEPRAEPAAREAYTEFTVVQPSQQATLWNIGAVLDVQVNLEPGLQPGHHLGVYYDGQLLDLGATSMQFQVSEVYRGMHTLQAVVLDAEGRPVLRSLPVEFMVQQTSVLNPNNPNANPRVR